MATTDPPLNLPLMAESGERRPEVKFNEAMQILNAAYLAASTLYGQLVSHWKFDETSGTREDSHGTNDLTDNNTVTSTTGVRTNAALAASANSEWLSVADNATLDFSTAFSLSVWINQTTLGVSRAIVGKWDYQTQGSWMLQTDDTNSDELIIYVATSLIDAGVTFGLTTDANLVTGTWYHLVLIYDGTLSGNANRLKLYINGVQKTLSFTGTIPASLQNSSADLKFGKFGGSLTRYFNGAFDEASIASRAWTAAEVAELYQSGAGQSYPYS